jgi:hypothetical protein
MERAETGGNVAVSTVASAPSGDAGLDRRRMNLVLVTVLLGMLLAALDQTIVSTALPTIVGDLGGVGHLSWVVFLSVGRHERHENPRKRPDAPASRTAGDLDGRYRPASVGPSMLD